MVEYDIVKDLYKLEFVADSEVHLMTFEDVLSVLPESWFGEQASAHRARVIHSLARAAHAACYLGISNKPIQIAPLLSEKFTEPEDYKMCCKAPDYSEWLKAIIKEIKELEKMLSWQVVKLSSMPHGAKLISCRWMFKLRYRNGAYERHRARLSILGARWDRLLRYHRQLTSSVSRRAPKNVLHKRDFYRHPRLRHCDNRCHHYEKPYLHQTNHSNRHEHDRLGVKI